jgi:hypothetical protein
MDISNKDDNLDMHLSIQDEQLKIASEASLISDIKLFNLNYQDKHAVQIAKRFTKLFSRLDKVDWEVKQELRKVLYALDSIPFPVSEVNCRFGIKMYEEIDLGQACAHLEQIFLVSYSRLAFEIFRYFNDLDLHWSEIKRDRLVIPIWQIIAGGEGIRNYDLFLLDDEVDIFSTESRYELIYENYSPSFHDALI